MLLNFVRRGEPPVPAEDRTLPHHIRDARSLPAGLVYFLVLFAAFGVYLQAGPLVPWFKQTALGMDETAATGLHFGWTVVAIAVILILVTYVQGHRGTRGFALNLAGVTTGLVAYLWMMGITVEDPVEAETWKFVRVGVNLGLVFFLCLQQIPWLHRRFAAIGLSFSAPDKPIPQLPLVDAHSGRARAPWAYRPGGRMLVGFLVVYHITAIAFWELPEKDCVTCTRPTN